MDQYRYMQGRTYVHMYHSRSVLEVGHRIRPCIVKLSGFECSSYRRAEQRLMLSLAVADTA